MRSVLALVILAACGGARPTGNGSGAGSGTGSAADPCEAAIANARSLYDAEAKATDQATHDPTFVDDNVSIVAKDCARDPARVAACARGATSVAQLEKDCLVPLDEEGTEGDHTP
jgi:hypothetical protein